MLKKIISIVLAFSIIGTSTLAGGPNQSEVLDQSKRNLIDALREGVLEEHIFEVKRANLVAIINTMEEQNSERLQSLEAAGSFFAELPEIRRGLLAGDQSQIADAALDEIAQRIIDQSQTAFGLVAVGIVISVTIITIALIKIASDEARKREARQYIEEQRRLFRERNIQLGT